MFFIYLMNNFEMVQIASVITGIAFVFYIPTSCISSATSLYFTIFSAHYYYYHHHNHFIPNLERPQFVVENSLPTISKILPVTCYEGTEGRRRIALIFNLGDKWGGWSTPSPGRVTAAKETRYPFTGGWINPRAGLEGYVKSRPHRGRNPGLFSP
jgi:hypothetical protein